jgi:type IV secretory pathway VirB3-like protein
MHGSELPLVKRHPLNRRAAVEGVAESPVVAVGMAAATVEVAVAMVVAMAVEVMMHQRPPCQRRPRHSS